MKVNSSESIPVKKQILLLLYACKKGGALINYFSKGFKEHALIIYSIISFWTFQCFLVILDF